MAKTYTAAGTVVAGEVYTASAHNIIATDVNNLIVPPMVRCNNSAAISIANNSAVALTFDTDVYDNDAMHSTSVNTGRITFNTAGVYILAATIEWAPNATGGREILLRLNGATILGGNSTIGIASYGTNQNASIVYSFSEGDYADVIVRQQSGGALNVGAASAYTPYFMATWMGRTS